ncbi:Similar to Bcl3: B-cell lymphoma 3 protein homolog (Mus musculus) [Cotesia congregata]|uniref:Similar to Bcl3: B-cell lymphoma 3 protein homolog (Mus musculus) n=1 Tax=Cotesia congregata TaxID=51543 RepID=A0A8J2HMF8_COTCN|nr:Similar to Bcl3: B-cell lymphoma 3 protein homolog (Mus musculus) [Cotesia congregata]
MESESAIPRKRARSSSSSGQPAPNLSLTECVREFALPQAYPSMAKGNDSSSEAKAPAGATQKSMKLAKFKIKTKDGRELDMKIMPQNTPVTSLNGKTISFSLAKPLIRSDQPVNIITKGDTLVTTATGTSDIKPSMLASSQDIYKSLNKNPNSAVKYIIPPHLRGVKLLSDFNSRVNMPSRSNVTNSIYQLDDNNIVVSNDDSIDLTGSSYGEGESNGIVMQQGRGWRVLKKEPERTVLRNVQNKSANITDDNNLNGQKPALLRRGTSLLNRGKNLPFKTVKNANQSNIINKQVNSNGQPGSRLIRIAGNKRGFDHGYALAADISDQNMINIIDDSNGIINLDDSSNLDGNTVYVFQNDDLLDQEQAEAEVNVKNTPQSVPLVNSQGRVNLIRRGNNKSTNSSSNKLKKDGNPRKSGSPMESYRSPYLREDLTDEELSDKLNVVGEALSTVSDGDLKMRALRALEECGFGMERFIPKKPPHNYLSVKDTSSQTNVFGLLDKNDFIRVTGDSNGVERLHEIEKQLINGSKEVKRKPCTDTANFKEALDEMLDKDVWVDKTRVEQVKNMLKINPTSLELAIQHSAQPEIVSLLLKNGANPVSPENAHDSALIIASRMSSDHLPQLVKSVSPNNPAINNVDSEGFTALHHCARNGNYRGVMCLIAISADVNARDGKSGRTALFHAFENEGINICKELLTAGAKPNIPNFAGHTVLSIFDEEKHFLLKGYIQKYQK